MNAERSSASRWESPWVWIGIGCGVLILVGGLLITAVYPLVKKYRELRDHVRSAPAMVLAEMMARRSQDLVVLSRDLKNRSITLENPQTGERFLLEQMGEDQLRIRTGAGEMAVRFLGPGGIVEKGGDTRLLLGSSAGPPPSWIPALPGMKLRALHVFRGRWGSSGMFALDTKVPASEVLAFYREQLSDKGFRVKVEERHEATGVSQDTASSPDGRMFTIVIIPHGHPEILLSYSERQIGSPGANRLES